MREGNRRGAIEDVIARTDRNHPTKVFLSQQVQYGDYHWRFYAIKAGRDDLLSGPQFDFFEPSVTPPERIPSGALVLTTATASVDVAFAERAKLTLVKQIADLDGTVSFLVFQNKHNN